MKAEIRFVEGGWPEHQQECATLKTKRWKQIATGMDERSCVTVLEGQRRGPLGRFRRKGVVVVVSGGVDAR